MKAQAEQDRQLKPRLGKSLLVYGSGALAIWLGWEIIKVPIAQRAPAELAVRVAPLSHEVLGRAAAGELADKRLDNAIFLARASLAKAPINASALRTMGLSLADSDPLKAEQIMTLAGNLSLRDNATHSWLVQQRLTRGDYVSSFAHADTLLRRRIELSPDIFNLFTTAALTDPRALSALVLMIQDRPPWRQNYFEYLYLESDRAPLVATLTLALEQTDGRLTDEELAQLYAEWVRQKRIAGVSAIRERLNRPGTNKSIQNADFEEPLSQQVLPFGWTLGVGQGFTAAVGDVDDGEHGSALWIQYDGFSSGLLAEQLLMLPTGAVTVAGEWRVEDGESSDQVGWQIVCAGTEQTISVSKPPINDSWRRFSFSANIPADDCSVQSLKLTGFPSEFRRPISIWVDNLSIVSQ